MAIATYNGNEPYIFVSYAHKDSDVVLPIIEALADNGFRVWYDAGIEAGSEWPSYIQDHITRCEKMIVFVTANCVKSPYCRREINLAVKLNKDILVVYLEDADLLYGLDFQLGIYQDIRRSNFTEERLFLQKLNEATILSSCRCASKFSTSAQKSTDSLLSDFEIENGVLKKYVGESDAVVIPYGVKSIERAFSGCDQVKRVEIPNSVTRIGKHAFSRCASLINMRYRVITQFTVQTLSQAI